METIRFKRHESFTLREGWIEKAINALKEENETFSDVFNAKKGISILGIGSNMVKSLKYWLTACKIITPTGVSDLGKAIYNNDRYLDDINTIYLIHYHLVENETDAFIINHFFNDYPKTSFTKKELIDWFKDLIEKDGRIKNKNYDSINSDIDLMLRMYSYAGSNDDPENNMASSFSRLGLLIDEGKDNYSKAKTKYNNLSPYIVYWVLSVIYEGTDHFVIDDMLDKDGSPAKVFNLDKNLINEYLNNLQTQGFFVVNRTAGLNTVYFTDKRISSLDELFEYVLKGDLYAK